MKDELQGSPYRRHRNDPEAGGSSRYDYDDDDAGSPFSIVRTKRAPIDKLRRWRVSWWSHYWKLMNYYSCIQISATDLSGYAFQQAALVLNASRRFRYTLDLKKEEERKELIAKIRMHAQVVRVLIYFLFVFECSAYFHSLINNLLNRLLFFSKKLVQDWMVISLWCCLFYYEALIACSW